MKKFLICLSIIATIAIGNPVYANAAGFVPVAEGSTIGRYYVDEGNTQFYYAGFINIDGKLYGFDKDGYTNIAQTFEIDNPEIMAIWQSTPAQVISENDYNVIMGKTTVTNEASVQQPTSLVLSNGVILDTSTVTTKDGYTVSLVNGKVRDLKYVKFTEISIKYNFQSPKGEGYCHLGLYDADGFLIRRDILHGTMNGENTDTIMYSYDDEVALLKVEL